MRFPTYLSINYRTTVLFGMLLLSSVWAYSQDIRKDEIDPSTGKHYVETSIEALTKGFIYRFRTVDDKKYIEVRIQKHSNFRVAENDTLVFTLENGVQAKAVAVRGGQGDATYRPKSPGIKSLWSIFEIADGELKKIIESKPVAAHIQPKDFMAGFDEDLEFRNVKYRPAAMMQERIKLIFKG